MKKYSLVIALIVMIFAMGCGKEDVENQNVEGDSEVVLENGVLGENNDSTVDQEDKTIVLPDIEYEEWLTDVDDNKLIGFNLPFGEIGEVSKFENTVSVDIKLDEYSTNDITIVCSRDEAYGLAKWYDEEKISAVFKSPGSEGSLEKVLDTPYGVCKIFYCLTEGENVVNNVYGLLKLNDEWGVVIEGYELDENKKAGVLFIEKVIFALLNSNNTYPTNYDYPNKLKNDEGIEIIGFNTPVGMTREEATMIINGVEETLDGIWFDGNRCGLSIKKADFRWAAGIESGEYAWMNFYLKKEIETVYGVAKIYEMNTTNGIDDTLIYGETAVINVNGQNVVIDYSDYGADGYTGKLEEIIQNQLFIQE